MKYSYVFCLAAVLLFGGCSMQKGEKVTHTDIAMGTIVQQTLYLQENGGEQLVSEVMSLLDDLEKDTLSWRMENSEVGRINRQAGQEGILLSDSMQQYLEVVGEVWQNSGGALDVTIGSVTQLWDIDTWAQNEGVDLFVLPQPADIERVLADTGFEKIKVENEIIRLPDAFELDLGAVGKGIGCDQIRDFLKDREEVNGAVISIGGSVLTYGEKTDNSSWNVAIRHPRKKGESIAVLELKGTWCISTSGDYERYVEKDGVRYHHIIDPKTGYPADSGLISVTIVSESGILSDALSTACFVMGKDAGLELAEKYGAYAYIIDKNMNVYMTEGMDKLLVLQ